MPADPAALHVQKARFPGEVLVVGEALIDIVDQGGTTTEHVGGSPANVALGLGRRGISVDFLTQFADDERGRMIVDHLEESGVAVLPESMTAGATSTSRARIAPDGQATYEFDVDWGVFRAPPGIAPRLVHTGSIAAFLDPGAASVLHLLRETTSAEITFDPNIRAAFLGERGAAIAAYEAVACTARVVKMSDEDAEWLYPGLAIDQVVDNVLALGPALVAITRGGRGAVIATATTRAEVPAATVAVADTIGAGDTFMASLIHSVLELGSTGLELSTLERIGRAAVHAASITVGRRGADLPWRSELPA